MNRFFKAFSCLIVLYHAHADIPDSCLLNMYPLNDQTDELFHEGNSEQLVDRLSQLVSNPLNLNAANYNSLAQLPFLTNNEAQKVVEHRAVYGSLRSFLELFSIGINQNRLECLQHITFIDAQAPFSPPIVQLSNQLVYRHNQPGKAFRNRVRLTGNVNRVQFGVHGEWTPDRTPFHRENGDHRLWVNGYLGLQSASNCFFKKAVIGKFHLESGQGLGIHTGMPRRSGMPLEQMKHSGLLLRGSNSFYRAMELNGLAVQFEFGSIQVLSFASVRNLDVRLGDSSEPILWLTSGTGLLESTPTSLKDGNREKLMGLVTEYRKNRSSMGAGVIQRNFHKSFIKEQGWLAVNQFEGPLQRRASLWVQHQMKGCYLYGEVSIQHDRKYSWVYGLYRTLGRHGTVFIQNRLRMPGTVDLHSSGYHRLSSRTGERGQLVGAQWKTEGLVNYRITVDRYENLWLSIVNRQVKQQTDIRAVANGKTTHGKWNASVRLKNSSTSFQGSEYQKTIRFRYRKALSISEYFQMEGQVGWLKGTSSALLVARIRKQTRTGILLTAQIAHGTVGEVDLYYLDPVPIGYFGLNRVTSRQTNVSIQAKTSQNHTWIFYGRYRFGPSPKFELLLQWKIQWKG